MENNDSDKKIKDEIIKAGDRIKKSDTNKQSTLQISNLGLCSDCEHLLAFQTKHGTIAAACSELNKRLNSFDPVIKCTCFWNRKHWKIHEMVSMAWLIDLKRPIGFIQDSWTLDED